MTNTTPQSLVVEHIATLTPYGSARKIGGQGIWLNANEYAKTPDCLAFDGTNNELLALVDTLNRYPNPQPADVISAYAQYARVNTNNVLMTRGGDEGIELIIRAFASPSNMTKDHHVMMNGNNRDDTVLYCPPTYGMYEVSSQTLGVATLKVNQIVSDKGFVLDLPAIEQALDTHRIKVIFICNPNNPTGNLLERTDLIRILTLTQNRAIVVIDEAYIEFSENCSMVNELGNYPNLIIIRTLSKAFGLAGIRAGFVLAYPQLIEALSKVIAPYPIPTPTAVIAGLALSSKQIQVMKNRVKHIELSRKKLIAHLQALSIVTCIYPTSTNFVLVQFVNGQAVFDYLWREGIIVRNQSQAVHLSDCIRITVGSDDENCTLIDLLIKFDHQYPLTATS